MYISSQQQEIKNWIHSLKQEMNKDDIMIIKSYYEEYRTIKGILKNYVQYFQKLGLLAEFYELFTVFQNDQKIDFTMFFQYRLLPVVVSGELHQPLISEYQIVEEDQKLLVEVGTKIQSIFVSVQKQNLFAMNIQNFNNKLTRLAYRDDGSRNLVELSYKSIYDFFCKYLEVFEQRKYFQLYDYYSSLIQSKINLKNHFKFEKTLTKILHLDLKQITEKQFNYFAQLNYYPKYIEFAANYKEKVQKIQCLQFESKIFNDFINYKTELAQVVCPWKNYKVEQIGKSDDLKYQIKTFGDDFQINLILASLPNNETIKEIQFSNRGLFEISFSETIQYFYILQSFSIEVYQIKPFQNILTFIVDLDYIEERFVCTKFYCNDQKLILISDLQIFFKTLHNGRFVLEKTISLIQISRVSTLKIIQPDNFQNCQIEIFSKINGLQILYCLIQANTGGLIKYYII